MNRLIALLGCATLLAASPALAAGYGKVSNNGVANPLTEDYITGYIGAYDITDNDSDTKAQFGAEYRFKEWAYGIRPTLGANFDWDGGIYGYGGFNWEIGLTDSLLLIPNLMAGLYHEGDSKDLGGAIEFRSGIELAYQLPNQHRVGIAFNHISNASIYDKNPGAETFLVNYSVPTSFIAR